MRHYAFNTFQSFETIPPEAKPALFTNTSIGIKLDEDWQIRFLVSVTQNPENPDMLTLSWSDDPQAGMPLFSQDEVDRCATMLQDFAIGEGMTPIKAAKAIYLVPRETGFRN